MTPDPQTRRRATCSPSITEAGVDALVGEEPVDRFAMSRAAARRRPRRTASAPRSCRLHSPAKAAPRPGLAALPRRRPMKPRHGGARGGEKRRNARRAARACSTDSTAARCTRPRRQLVFADGNPKARVMFVGEAPGRDEDIEGLPFVGRSGKLLDRMLAAIGLDRTQAYIANIVPWRPPGNRTPTPQETAICLPFILRQIELADPDILVCLGGPSTQTLLGIKEGITRTRGRWFTFDTGTREIRAMPTFHPAFLLRSPLQKRLAWRDFLAIKKALGA